MFLKRVHLKQVTLYIWVMNKTTIWCIVCLSLWSLTVLDVHLVITLLSSRPRHMMRKLIQFSGDHVNCSHHIDCHIADCMFPHNFIGCFTDLMKSWIVEGNKAIQGMWMLKGFISFFYMIIVKIFCFCPWNKETISNGFVNEICNSFWSSIVLSTLSWSLWCN